MFKREVESFDGDYFFVKREIEKKRKKENSTNARQSHSVSTVVSIENSTFGVRECVVD